jgi:hypothetical protein
MFTTLDKKEKMILASASALILLMILYKYWKGKDKNQESGYVVPRGFFQTLNTPVAPSTPIPPPIAPPPVAPPPVMPPPPVVPPPPIMPPPVQPVPPIPGMPYPLPYPYPYPYNNISTGYNYGTLPYMVIDQPVISGVTKSECYKNVKINGEDKTTCFSTKKDYVKFLKQSYNTLVDSYNDALYSFGWGRAMKIAKAMRKVKNDIDIEIGIA